MRKIRLRTFCNSWKTKAIWIPALLAFSFWLYLVVFFITNPFKDDCTKNITYRDADEDTSKMYGEMGKPVELPPEESENKQIQKFIADGWNQHGFNLYVSDLISVKRSLPDVRKDKCKLANLYPKNLPDASVIMCFQNEAWSTLIRSILSVLNRSPTHLLRELILIDDSSSLDYLKQPLDDYVSELKPRGIVKILRLETREGLIRCRLTGAKVAKGAVLVFLDSHIEATNGWLEPLLNRIHQNWSNVAVPIIDSIASATFKFQGDKEDPDHTGTFNWSLFFRWFRIPPEEKKRMIDSIDPLPTPAMAGGLFAISKTFFKHLGGYDKNLLFWGGENMELSFKTWMCGGSLDIIPCSHVGHVFRSASPIKWPKNASGRSPVWKNVIRVAKVWLDEYQDMLFSEIGKDKKTWNVGSIRKEVATRKRLKCKSFRWYLENVHPQMFAPRNPLARGEIRNIGSYWGTKSLPLCLDHDGEHDLHKSVGIYACHMSGGNQNWYFMRTGEIRKISGCLQAPDSKNEPVVLKPCDPDKKLLNQQWLFEEKTNQIRLKRDPKMCLGVVPLNTTLTTVDCVTRDKWQHWRVENFNKSSLPGALQDDIS